MVALFDFAGKCLHSNARALDSKVHIQTVLEIVPPPADAMSDFPLKKRYDWFSGEVEGLEEALRMDPGILNRKKRSRKESKQVPDPLQLTLRRGQE